ncbi:MAG TPA: hypothetical protein VGH07_09055, partial [Chthoniobacterales bacterium]
ERVPGNAHYISLESKAAGDLFDLGVDPFICREGCLIHRVLVFSVRCLHCRSVPMRAPNTNALPRRNTNSIQDKCALAICSLSVGQASTAMVRTVHMPKIPLKTT